MNKNLGWAWPHDKVIISINKNMISCGQTDYMINKFIFYYGMYSCKVFSTSIYIF